MLNDVEIELAMYFQQLAESGKSSGFQSEPLIVVEKFGINIQLYEKGIIPPFSLCINKRYVGKCRN